MATPLSTANGLKGTEFAISEPADCAVAQDCARRVAAALGFPHAAGEEITLVAAELASNLLKHAGSGVLSLRAAEEHGSVGIEIAASDSGPGMQDIEQSFADGYSSAGTLGYGLGAINRLMDEIDVNSAPGCGTRIACRRWLRAGPEAEAPQAWSTGVFTRSRYGAKENGDAFVVKHWQGRLLVGLIDGLGHGELAQKAASAARNYVQSHYDQPLERIFEGAGRACRSTRGVVMALARFDSRTRMQFASVGNVEVRAHGGNERIGFVVKRGVLGMQPIKAHVQEIDWNPGWLFVLHTDGLQTHWQWSDFPGIDAETPQAVAARLMRSLATDHDDATVLAVRNKTS